MRNPPPISLVIAIAGLTAVTTSQNPSWSTFYGGSCDEGIAWNGIAQLPNGHIVVVGPTCSTNLPVPGAIQANYGGGTSDGFVACFDPDALGTAQCVWATYLGGTDYDEITGIAIANNGDVLVCGASDSPNLPTTPGSLQPNLAAGLDWFVARLRFQAGALALVSCTYVGGPSGERPVAIAEQSTGNLVVAGWSDIGFPTASGSCPAYQPAPGGGLDGVIAVLDPSGATLLASSWFGLSGDDLPTCLTLDSDRPVVGGITYSGVSTTPGAYERAFIGGPSDGFVARFDANLCTLQYATHLGGGGAENLQSIAVMPNGDYAVGGWTGPGSPIFPTTTGPGYAGGPWDAFIATLDPTALGNAQLTWARLAGGAGSDGIWSLAVDTQGLITAVGETGPFGVLSDGWLLRFDPPQLSGCSLPFETPLGNSGNDRALGVALDASGDALIAGSTTSANWPTTTGAFQTRYGGASPVPWPSNPLAGYGDTFLMRYATPSAVPGGFQQLPAGCTGSVSSCSGRPLAGDTVSFDVIWWSPGNMSSAPIGLGFLVADFGGNLGWNGLQVPQLLGPLGMPGCLQVAGIDVSAPLPLLQIGPPLGVPPVWYMQGSVTIRLPGSSLGWSFALQALLLNSHGAMTVTDGWQVSVGLR